MVARNAPRPPDYFGASPPGPFGGQDPAGGRSPGGVSSLTGTRNVPTLSQPIVTYIENEPILAEAYFRLGPTAHAQTRFDHARASVTRLAAKTITSIADIKKR